MLIHLVRGVSQVSYQAPPGAKGTSVTQRRGLLGHSLINSFLAVNKIYFGSYFLRAQFTVPTPSASVEHHGGSSLQWRRAVHLMADRKLTETKDTPQDPAGGICFFQLDPTSEHF